MKLYKMAQIQVFDSATTGEGAGAESYDRPGTVGELRQAIVERYPNMRLNNFFLNAAGRQLADEAALGDIEYVTIMHVSSGSNNPTNASTTGGRRRNSRKHRKGSRKHRKNSRKSRKSSCKSRKNY